MPDVKQSAYRVKQPPHTGGQDGVDIVFNCFVHKLIAAEIAAQSQVRIFRYLVRGKHFHIVQMLRSVNFAFVKNENLTAPYSAVVPVTRSVKGKTDYLALEPVFGDN